MKIRAMLLTLAALMLLAACTDQELIDSLPPIPPVPLDAALPAVQEQLRELQSAVEDRPGNGRAAAALGVHYLAYQFNDAAEVALRRAVQLDPDNADFAYFHAEARVRSGDLAGAAESLATLLTHTPGDSAARRRLGQVLLEQGDAAGARDALAAAVSEAPDDVYARLALGQAFLDLDQPRQAAEALNELLEQSGPFDRAHLALSQAYRALGDQSQAQAELARYARYRGKRPTIDDPRLAALLQLNISDAPLLEHAARMHAAGRLEEAVKALELAIERNPDAVSSRASLLALYASQGLEAPALKHFEAGRAIDPDYPPLFYGLGVLRNRQLLPVEARKALEQALSLDPNNANARYELAQTARFEDNNEEALAHLRAALELAPEARHMRVALAQLLLVQGDPGGAADAFERAAKPDSPRSPELWFSASQAWLNGGDKERARQALESGLASARSQGLQTDEQKINAALQSLQTNEVR
ncbi:MAG: tetratricopeptide repeat protein [Pseudomonadota bacterium]